MPKTLAYLRISSDRQDIDSQRLMVLEYARQQRYVVDAFIEFEGASRVSLRERRIEELLAKLEPGDTLIVSELSRIGRSLGEIIEILNKLVKKGVSLHAISQGMHLSGAHDISTKAQIAVFASGGDRAGLDFGEDEGGACSGARAEGETDR